MLGTGRFSASLHCCEHFMSMALRSSLTLPNVESGISCIGNSLYCKWHDCMDTKNNWLFNHLHNYYELDSDRLAVEPFLQSESKESTD